MIVFLTHKINPKVFCPNFGVHFTVATSRIISSGLAFKAGVSLSFRQTYLAELLFVPA